MDLAEKVGQLFIVPLPGSKLTLGGKRILRRLTPGGVILFSHNFGTAEEARSFITELKGSISPSPLIAIDEEGGPVSRLNAIFPPLPSAMALGATGSEILAYRQGQSTGRLLSFLGVELNFAPVLDLALSHPENGIGVRSFGSNRELVAKLGGSYLKGLHREGVFGVVKHFPGLGESRVDSHHQLPIIKKDREKLISDDIYPFQSILSSPPYPSVMVGHGFYPSLSPEERLPASLCPAVISDLLRGELGVTGLIFTDDLAMGAVVDRFSPSQAAKQALSAGAEMLITTHPWEEVEKARNHLIYLIERGEFPVSKLEAAVNRILIFKRKLKRKKETPLSSFSELSAELNAHSLAVAEKGASVIKAWKKGLSSTDQVVLFLPHDPLFCDPLSGKPEPIIKETVEKLIKKAEIETYPRDKVKLPPAKIALVVVSSYPIKDEVKGLFSEIRKKYSHVFVLLFDFPLIPADLSPDGALALYFKGAVPLSVGISILLGKLPSAGFLPLSSRLIEDE
jgi:beta-N-acetylhexosaminidase